MRRIDREIKDIEEIFQIVRGHNVAHIAMSDNGKPYIAVMNYGYERKDDGLILYFHSAGEGRKIDILRAYPQVYFIIDLSNGLIGEAENNPCALSWSYASVAGEGKVEFIESDEEKSRALDLIISQANGGGGEYEYSRALLEKTCVFRIDCTSITGKRNR